MRAGGKGRPKAAARIAAALLSLPLLALGGCGDLNPGELNRGVESLGALAAQGELIADGVSRDRTKTTYARVMSRTLGDEAEHEAEKLADAEPSPEVRRQRDDAVRLAVRIADLYERIAVMPGDERVGRAVAAGMGDAADQADALVEALTGEPQ